jgi:outer membrane protein OmpA-like peptidoglycan-associated protein
MARNPVSVFLVCWLGIASAAGSPAHGAEGETSDLCTPERAGNETPAQALPLGGAFCIEGSLGKRRHLFAWTVPDGAPGQAWSIALDGGPGQDASLVLQRLEAGSAGALTAGDELFGAAMPEGGGSIRAGRLQLRPGSYLVALAGRSNGPYRLRFVPEAAPTPLGRTAESVDRAAPVTANAFLSGPAGAEHFFAWKIGAAEARRRWTIEANAALGEDLTIDLRRASGEVLVSRSRRVPGPLELSELGLDVGDYVLRIAQTGSPATPYTLRLLPGGPRVADREEEPNETIAQGRPMVLGRTVTGRLSPYGDVDFYTITADGQFAGKQVELSFQGSGKKRRKICLTNAAGSELQCRYGVSVKFSNLALEPGLYGVSVSGETETASYGLTLRLAGVQSPDAEREPNDTAATATAFDVTQPMRGRLAGSEDVDFFRFNVDGEPRLWTVTARGHGISSLRVLHNRGGRLGSGTAGADADDRVQATGLFLLPGSYWIELTGKDADYALEAKTIGPPDPNAEREPNDQDNHANLLRVGTARTGTLPDSSDRDVYRFSLAAPAHVALEVTPPEHADITVEIEWGYPDAKRPTATTAGSPLRYEAWLEPGDYLVRLRVDGTPSAAPYRIALSLLDPFELPDDLEPNDTPAQARPLPASLAVAGDVGRFRDEDWYELPLLAKASALRIDVEGDVALTLQDGKNTLEAKRAGKSDSLEARIPADRVIRLGVKGAGRYALKLGFTDGPKPAPAPAKLPVQIGIDLGKSPVAAYWIRGQRVNGTIVLKNTGSGPLELTLDARSSNYAFAPLLGTSRLSLPADAEQQVPIVVAVAPDAWADNMVQIAVRARSGDGRFAAVTSTLAIDATAAPLAEAVSFPLPKELLGGINVAATAFGGRVVVGDAEAASAADRARLHDGLVSTTGFAVMAYTTPVTLTTQLGGDRPWPIAGITLQPQIENRLYPAEQLKDFELLLSADGTNFETVLSGSLSLLPIEQAFVLPKPVAARAAQLRLKSNHAGNSGNIGLNEWKVIAVPGEPRGASLNIADPTRGGHVVWADPMIGVSADDSRAMLDGRRSMETKVSAGSAPQFVVGFNEDRAAQLSGFQWVEDAAAKSDVAQFSTIRVETSIEGPFGPWKELGIWTLQRDDKGIASWSLPEPAWARFVRFSATAKSGKAGVWAYPKALRVSERPAGGDYLSILGEWGQYNRDAVFEASRPNADKAMMPSHGESHGTREAPLALAIGKPAASEVRLGEVEDWYAINIPPAATMLTLTTKGEPTVDVDLDLEDESGAAVPLRVVSSSSGELSVEAAVKAGAFYRARVREPPRSVAIAYDTSGSLAPFSTAVYQAVLTFAGGVAQRREFVNFMNFASPFLLEDWSDQSWALQGALLAPHQESDSSDLPATMKNALAGLRHRRGVRAMIVVTDAETPGYDRESDMWAALADVRPRIFTAHIGAGADPLREKQIMQDLAAVNAGFYASARTQAGMDVVAERAAAWLRRPARYEMTATVGSGPPPQPGTIAVVSSTAGSYAANAAQMAQALEDTGKVDIHGINFDVDKTIIKPSSAATLAQVAKLLKDQPLLTLEVGGHTDNTGGADHNLKLSAGRAAAVVDSLVKRYGVAASRLRAQGYGDTRPVAGNDTDAGRAMNRRVELKQISAADIAGSPRPAPGDGDRSRQGRASLQNAPYAVIDRGGKQVLTGTVNGSVQEIASGDYTVTVTAGAQTIDQAATVKAGSATIVQVSLADAGGAGGATQASSELSRTIASLTPPAAPVAPATPAARRKSRSEKPGAVASLENRTAPRGPPPGSENSQLSGIATVLDTGTIVVAGKIVKLSGVIGELGIYSDQMAAYIGRNPVTCTPATKGAYHCEMSGQSLAKAAVFNGGARAAADAPAEIRSAEQNARDARRGIWQSR